MMHTDFGTHCIITYGAETWMISKGDINLKNGQWKTKVDEQVTD